MCEWITGTLVIEGERGKWRRRNEKRFLDVKESIKLSTWTEWMSIEMHHS